MMPLWALSFYFEIVTMMKVSIHLAPSQASEEVYLEDSESHTNVITVLFMALINGEVVKREYVDESLNGSKLKWF